MNSDKENSRDDCFSKLSHSDKQFIIHQITTGKLDNRTMTDETGLTRLNTHTGKICNTQDVEWHIFAMSRHIDANKPSDVY